MKSIKWAKYIRCQLKWKNKGWGVGAVLQSGTENEGQNKHDEREDWEKQEWEKKGGWVVMKKGKKRHQTFTVLTAARQSGKLKPWKIQCKLEIFSFVPWFEKRREVTPPYNKGPPGVAHTPFHLYRSLYPPLLITRGKTLRELKIQIWLFVFTWAQGLNVGNFPLYLGSDVPNCLLSLTLIIPSHRIHQIIYSHTWHGYIQLT